MKKMENRKIIHIDMDAFYASVEQRDHPEYRGKPLAVGRPEERGVVAAASYEARKFGIRSAMSSMQALKLCPDLIFVRGRMEHYKAVSEEIHRIFHEYTDLIEPLALDEAFLDVTENKKNIPLAVDIARAIKKETPAEATNPNFSRISFLIAAFIARLPIEVFWGIGKVTAHKMHALGIHNGAQLRNCSLEFLNRNFGKAGQLYYDFSHGVDLRPVEVVRIRKSVGCENTFEKDLTTHTALIIELWHVADELIRRLRKAGFKGHTLTLKIKFHDFTQKTRSISVGHELYTMKEILPLAKQLLAGLQLTHYRIRLMGLTVSNPVSSPDDPEQGIPTQLEINF